MSLHLQREIEDLKKRVLSLSALAEESVQKAVSSLSSKDAALAHEVIAEDSVIDRMEVEVEEECLKILALHQPVATDLRFIVAVLKINNDLERIGDLSVNIAERALFLHTVESVPAPFDFPGMARKAQSMLSRALDSLVNLDAQAARQVCVDDDEVDEINRTMYRQVQEGIEQYPDWIDCYIHLLGVSRHLERIADHATNIAEDVIYMIEGEIVRHRTERYEQRH